MIFLLYLSIPTGSNPVETNYPWGLVRFRGIQSGRNNKCMKKIVILTRIYTGSKINLPIMIGRIRDRRAGLVPHLLISGLIPSFFVYLSWANKFSTRNKSRYLIVTIMIFFVFIHSDRNWSRGNEWGPNRSGHRSFMTPDARAALDSLMRWHVRMPIEPLWSSWWFGSHSPLYFVHG
jgi:hypothetical protein